MTIPEITLEDILSLNEDFRSLDFSHPESHAVLTAQGSVDVQAAPGSGKTTLLAAKLSILARKWAHQNRGICIVSHTNVAREEIEARLRESRHGSMLFAHPHFIGTIQTFIHKFLSLPVLRSNDITLRVIDDDEHYRISEARYKRVPVLRNIARNSPNRYGKALTSLRYSGPELKVVCAEGSLPGENSESYAAAVQLKNGLAADGIFRYDDMFALAQHVLWKFPSMKLSLSHRFPLVFIDEMQDTSDPQYRLLFDAIGGESAFQRYGDVNQRILRAGDSLAATFPAGPQLAVSTSKRFGRSIAQVANCLRIFGDEISGDFADATVPITMYTFTDDSVRNVIAVFESAASRAIPNEHIERYGIKAIGRRKSEVANGQLGRYLGDYGAVDTVTAISSSAQLACLHIALLAASDSKRSAHNIYASATRTRTALVHLLRELGWPPAIQAKSWRQMLNQADDAASVRAGEIVEHLLSTPPACNTAAEWDAVLAWLASKLTELTDAPVSPATLSRIDIARFTDVGTPANQNGHDAAVLPAISELKTIASVKGETHAATLVLECVHNRVYDVEAILPYLTGEQSSLDERNASAIDRLHNMFVAATRPRYFLAFAMHAERLSDANRDRLIALGWNVEAIT